MKPAIHAHRALGKSKLLILESSGVQHVHMADLARYLEAGDLLVVNRSGTMASSFDTRLMRTGQTFEFRLAAFQGVDSQRLNPWLAVAFGAGDWRDQTEDRGPAPSLIAGDDLWISAGLRAQVIAVGAHPRQFSLRFIAEDLPGEIYRRGRPIQYSYLTEELAVWDQQTLFAGPRLSVEPPSAAFALDWEQVLRLKQRGVKVASLLHAAGISSTGDSLLDAQLPFAEYFEVPAATLSLARQTRAQGRRVIALGTTVARALESAVHYGQERGLTTLKLGPAQKASLVNGLLTGMHEAGTSHAALMSAFCAEELMRQATVETAKRNYRSHEYGDVTLLLA